MPAEYKITKWNPQAIEAAALRKMEGKMGLAVTFVKGQVMRAINRGNPSGKFPSKPGEPPKKVKAILFNSIFTRVQRVGKQVLGIVGSNTRYARWLELGTENMEARPFLRPTIAKNQDRIRVILGAKRK